MKKTRIIAAAFAAAMTMTTAAAISASAESTEIKSDEFVCIWDVPEEKVPTLFEQVQKWIDQISQKKNEPQKKRLVDMYGIEIERLVKTEYNMTLRQFYDAAYDLRKYLQYNCTLEQTEIFIRDGMKRASDFRCEPTWNEDMIRFLKDYWDEFSEYVRTRDLKLESINVYDN
ncbi:hypothetical protein SAMN02910317_01777 [Ruminococcaceae bacterium FB2012]|nr:hypothetical protein SAMN02910317_01777 [Ruminococcaceae bacterium FB2012]